MAHCNAFSVCWTATLSTFCQKSFTFTVATEKRCRHRSGRAAGCISVKQSFQYHGLLNRWIRYFAENQQPPVPHPASQARGGVLIQIVQCPSSLIPLPVAASTHFPFFRGRRCPRSATLEMLITWRFFLSAGEGHRDHASVVMDEELTTTSQESHLGDHLSVAVIHPQWNYTKSQNNSHLLL